MAVYTLNESIKDYAVFAFTIRRRFHKVPSRVRESTLASWLSNAWTIIPIPSQGIHICMMIEQALDHKRLPLLSSFDKSSRSTRSPGVKVRTEAEKGSHHSIYGLSSSTLRSVSNQTFFSESQLVNKSSSWRKLTYLRFVQWSSNKWPSFHVFKCFIRSG